MCFNVDVKELINDIENRTINCCYLIIKSLSINSCIFTNECSKIFKLYKRAKFR